MEYLIAHGVDFTKVYRNLPRDKTLIAMIARLGLTELISKVIDKVKLFDGPSFMKTLVEAGDCNYPEVCPVLQIASELPIWNMEMIKLLVEEGHVDVNARCYLKEVNNHKPTGKIISGGTALHVLAKADYWWQADAIQYLVEQGKIMMWLMEVSC